MRIISFCNKQAYIPYTYLIKSAEKQGFLETHQFVLYTIGFKVENPHPKVTYKQISLDVSNKPESARRVKPFVLLQALKDFEDEAMLYLDTDHFLGKRFDPKSLLNKASTLIIPLASFHPCNLDPNWKKGLVDKINYALNSSYELEYTQTNVILFGKESKSFLRKWSNLCLNPQYTNKLNFPNYAAGDEIVYNSILCRTNGKLNLGQCHLNITAHNKTYLDIAKYSEEHENHFHNIGIPECKIINTSTIMFYHGCKDPNLLEKHI